MAKQQQANRDVPQLLLDFGQPKHALKLVRPDYLSPFDLVMEYNEVIGFVHPTTNKIISTQRFSIKAATVLDFFETHDNFTVNGKPYQRYPTLKACYDLVYGIDNELAAASSENFIIKYYNKVIWERQYPEHRSWLVGRFDVELRTTGKAIIPANCTYCGNPAVYISQNEVTYCENIPWPSPNEFKAHYADYLPELKEKYPHVEF